MRCVPTEGDISKGRLLDREKGEEERECGRQRYEKLVVRHSERPIPYCGGRLGEGGRVR